MESGTWSAFARAVVNPLLGLVPWWLLRRWYPIQKLRERILVLAVGIGPDIYVGKGQRLVLSWDDFTIFNFLPFTVELVGLSVEVVVEATSIGTWDKVAQQAIAGIDRARVSLIQDLSDSQAELVKKYSSCPKLTLKGTANFRTPVIAFDRPFQVETRAFVHRDPAT